MARMVRSNEPCTRRKSSWAAACEASREMARRATPCCFILAIDSSVSRGVALGVTDGSRPDFAGVGDHVVEVVALQRIAAGDDEDARLEQRDLIDEGMSLFSGQLELAAAGLRGRAAVDAGKIAGPGHFPDDDERIGVEVHAARAEGRAAPRAPRPRPARFHFHVSHRS